MNTDNQQADLQNMPPSGLQQMGSSQQCKEVVKRKTKRHEYVEVDGFHFRRKRRAPPTPLANAAAANSAAAAAAGGAAGASPAKQSPAAVKHTLQLDDAAQPSPAKSPAPAPAADTDAGMADQDAADAPGEELPARDLAGAVDPEAAAAASLSLGAEAGVAAASQQAAAAAAAAAAEAAELAAAAAQAAAAAAAAEAAAEELEMVEASDEPPENEQQHESLGSMQFSMLPSELCHLVGSFLAAELHKLPGCSPSAAQQAADSIKQQLARQLQQRQAGAADASQGAGQGGEGQQGDGEGAEGVSGGQEVPPLTVLPYQVEELKAKLADKHSKLLQEQEAWMQLLAQYNAMTSSTPGAAEGAGNPSAPGAASPQHQQDAQGAEAAAGAEAEAPADVPMTDAEEQDASAAAAAAAAAAEIDGVEGPVCAEQQETLLGVQLKVEVLTALVSKMEHLVSRAEATARALQAGYRAEKFSIFPHVDSPAALIKSLAGRGSQATQGGTQGNTQGA